MCHGCKHRLHLLSGMISARSCKRTTTRNTAPGDPGPAEIAVRDQPSVGARAKIARAYDDYLVDFAIGDYGQVVLRDGERRAVVRQRLQAAARRRGLALRFRSSPGPLTFRVVAAPEISATPPQEPLAAVPVAAPVAGRRPQRPPRPPRCCQTAAERYHDVLPRWMRAGQQPERRGGSKRRAQ
jgi:hypothetical protein